MHTYIFQKTAPYQPTILVVLNGKGLAGWYEVGGDILYVGYMAFKGLKDSNACPFSARPEHCRGINNVLGSSYTGKVGTFFVGHGCASATWEKGESRAQRQKQQSRGTTHETYDHGSNSDATDPPMSGLVEPQKIV